MDLGRFCKTCWKSALCFKALAWAPYFSNLGPKPYVWVWVWGLVWIWSGFAKPVQNQLCALRAWPGPLTFPIWALSLMFGFGFGAWPGFGQVLPKLFKISLVLEGPGLGPLLFQNAPWAFCLGLGLGPDLDLGRFCQTCWKSALCFKGLAWAPYFSNLGPKPYVWVWVWGLTWIWVGFAKPVGNQPCALRAWLGPLAFPIWALSLMSGVGFGAWPGFGQVLPNLFEISPVL